VNVCSECRHFSTEQTFLQAAQIQSPGQPQCRHPEAKTREPIYGLAYCHQERQSKSGCGRGGKLWEPRT